MTPSLSMTNYHVSTHNESGSHWLHVKLNGQLVYAQDRLLANDEVVNNLRNADNKVLYELHKPKKGWYLAIRAPGRSAFVQLKASRTPSVLTFEVPPGVFDGTRSSQTLETPLGSAPAKFVLQPHLPPHEKQKSMGLGHISSLFANRKNTFSLVCAAGGSQADREVLRFEDTTGMLATGSSGHLFIDETLIRELEVSDTAFFICTALAFLEYEEDAAAYHAANQDLLE